MGRVVLVLLAALCGTMGSNIGAVFVVFKVDLGKELDGEVHAEGRAGGVLC